MMKRLEKIVIVWGVFDVLTIAWYLGWSIVHKRIPFVYDIRELIVSTTSLGIVWMIVLSVFGLVIYLSLAASGYLLITHKKAGAIIAHIQTPFRLLMIIPPSIFFILWPLSFVTESYHIVLGYSLIIPIETMKTTSLIMWQVKSRNLITAV